jgi:hypothetical protein
MDLLVPEANVTLGQVMNGELLFHLTEETRAEALYVGVRAYQDVRRPTLEHDPHLRHPNDRGERRYEDERLISFLDPARWRAVRMEGLRGQGCGPSCSCRPSRVE